MKFIHNALVIICGVLLIWGCSGGNDGNTSRTITGKVVDNLGNPLSEVTVTMYNAKNTNEIDQIRSQALGVGFDDYEKLMFNTPGQSSVGSGKTNSSGEFNVGINSSSSKVDIKLFKQGYGQNWFAGLKGSELSNLVCLEDSVLHDDTFLNNFFVQDTLVFKQNKLYEVLSNETVNFSVSGSGVIIFEEGSKIILGDNAAITFQAKFLFVNANTNNPVLVISSSTIPWEKIEFNLSGDQVIINGLSCVNANQGMIFSKKPTTPNITINNSFFDNLNGGLQLLTQSNFTFSENIISNCNEGLQLSSGIDSSRIDSNIFINSNNPLRIEGQGFDEENDEKPIYSSVTNNYFKSSLTAIDAVTVDLKVADNTINNCEIGMNFDNGCRGFIANNIIESVGNASINIKQGSYAWGRYDSKFYGTNGAFSNNNFNRPINSTNSFINDDTTNVNAKNNYWYTTNFDTLESIIRHDVDFGFEDPKGEVIFSPYKTFEIPNIGAK